MLDLSGSITIKGKLSHKNYDFEQNHLRSAFMDQYSSNNAKINVLNVDQLFQILAWDHIQSLDFTGKPRIISNYMHMHMFENKIELWPLIMLYIFFHNYFKALFIKTDQ